MALITPTVTVDAQTGQPINSISGVAVTESVVGVVIRPKMCVGAAQVREVNLSLTIPAGTVTSFNIPGANPVPISTGGPRPLATMVVQQGSSADEENWVEGTNFTLDGLTINFMPNMVGTGKVATISYTYYDTTAANLIYDTPVYPSNCRGVLTQNGTNVILWNEGILAQSPKFFATTGTVNGVIEALITDA